MNVKNNTYYNEKKVVKSINTCLFKNRLLNKYYEFLNLIINFLRN